MITVKALEERIGPWDGKTVPPPGLAYCHVEDAPKFFRACREGGPYVLVSGASDFGLHYQRFEHPNRDLMRYLGGMDWGREADEAAPSPYSSLAMRPNYTEEECHPGECFIMKCDRVSMATFNELPANIACWHITNLNVVHPRMEWLPFGLPHGVEGLEERLLALRGRPKKGLLYVNFQDYTHERLKLKRHFRRFPWVTFREKANLPHEQFYEELAEHHFVLSPPGNGMDCYRNYESFCVGTVPILLDSLWAKYLRGLPVETVPDYQLLSESWLWVKAGRARERGVFERWPGWARLTTEFWLERLTTLTCQLMEAIR